MYMVRASRTSMTSETKSIVRKAKKEIDCGRNYKEVLADVREKITNSIQREKAIKSIIKYINYKIHLRRLM